MIPRYPAQLMFRQAMETRNIQLLRRLQASPFWSRIHPEVSLPSGQTPLQLLTQRAEPGDSEFLQVLLTHPRVDPSVEEDDALRNIIQVGGPESVEMARILLADRRVNPGMTPQKVDILRNSLFFDFDKVWQRWGPYFLQIRVSLHHALDKELIRLQAKNLTKLQVLESHASMLPNITNTVATYSGLRKNYGTVANRLNKLKGNYFGPKRETRKQRRNKST